MVGDLTANSVLVGVKASIANRVRSSTRDRCGNRKEETDKEKSFQRVHLLVYFKRGKLTPPLLFVLPPPHSFTQDSRVAPAPHLNKLSALPEWVVKSV